MSVFARSDHFENGLAVEKEVIGSYAMDVRELIQLGRAAFFRGDDTGYRSTVKRVSELIANLAARGQLDLALNLEGYWYNSLVKQVETEENYFQAFSGHKVAMWREGLKRRSPASATSEPRRVAFIVPNGVLLGHTQVMLKVFRDWSAAGREIDPCVISLSGFSSELAEPLRQVGVKGYYPKATGLSPTQALDWCRSLVQHVQCKTAVWVSVPTWVSYAFGLGLAPSQVLWSLKFHPVHLGRGVRHIAMTYPGDGEVLINNDPWIRFSPPLSVRTRRRDWREVARVRAGLGAKFVFGALARTEKFNSLHYVETVADIISQCPGSVFVYTGASESPIIKDIFAKKDLPHRVRYVGWVDTELYSQVLDVFLETFPFGCGITGGQAVDLGTPVVSLWDDSTLPRFYFSNVEEATEATSHWKVVSSVSEYKRLAVALFEGLVGQERVDNDLGALSSLDSNKSDRFYEILMG